MWITLIIYNCVLHLMLIKHFQNHIQDSEDDNASSSNCSFEGKSIFCGENGDEFDFTFWVSLVNKNHRCVQN